MRAKLTCAVCRDVPDMLVEWRNEGIKSYIYSSGSREAQRLFFEHSQAGDLRPFLCGFFDTASGAKTEAASYTNIQLSLGVDDADQVSCTLLPDGLLYSVVWSRYEQQAAGLIDKD